MEISKAEKIKLESRNEIKYNNIFLSSNAKTSTKDRLHLDCVCGRVCVRSSVCVVVSRVCSCV